MHRLAIALAAIIFLTGWGYRAPDWPHAGPMPDEPVAVPSQGYSPIAAGTRSYRPVEPKPWGDVNRSVAPPGTIPTQPQGPQAPPEVKPAPPATDSMPNMQH